jgi:NAD(P)-dependent dehydrogenase (short-subunit alcohol dehydrogenase family)
MTHPLFDLSGRVALVSGAASGLGRQMSIGFAEAGADLVLADINSAGAQETAHEIEKLGRRAIPTICDVSSVEQIRATYALIDKEFGRIDVVGNVAGEGLLSIPLEVTEEAIVKTLHNLVVGRFFSCQEAGRRMLKQGKGSIINIVSIGGITALGRSHVGYGMAMGAGAQMIRDLSTEWASGGVRVNGIVCAQITNKGLEKRMEADPKLAASFLRGLPIGRLGKPEEIKGPAIFLASDASSFVTGSLLPLDGGNLAKNAGGSHPGMPNATDE